MTDANILGYVLLAFQGIWGILFKRLLGDLDENTKATKHLAESISAHALATAQTFVTKDEWNETRRQLHDLAGIVQGMKAREDLRRDLGLDK